MMKKKTARKIAHSSARSVAKKHRCFFNFCVCKHPSFIASLIVLIITSFGLIYFMLAR